MHTSYLHTSQPDSQMLCNVSIFQLKTAAVENQTKQAKKAAANVQKWQWKEEEEEGKLNREVDNRKIQSSSSNRVVMQRRLIAVKREREEIDREEIY